MGEIKQKEEEVQEETEVNQHKTDNYLKRRKINKTRQECEVEVEEEKKKSTM